MIDSEAFGPSLEGDQSKPLWPPAPFNFDLASNPGVPPHAQQAAGLTGLQQNRDDTGRTPTDGETGQNGNMPTDLNGWVAANQFPMPGLSLGMGSSFGPVLALENGYSGIFYSLLLLAFVSLICTYLSI
jgi:hypothetical protein